MLADPMFSTFVLVRLKDALIIRLSMIVKRYMQKTILYINRRCHLTHSCCSLYPFLLNKHLTAEL